MLQLREIVITVQCTLSNQKQEIDLSEHHIEIFFSPVCTCLQKKIAPPHLLDLKHIRNRNASKETNHRLATNLYVILMKQIHLIHFVLSLQQSSPSMAENESPVVDTGNLIDFDTLVDSPANFANPSHAITELPTQRYYPRFACYFRQLQKSCPGKWWT